MIKDGEETIDSDKVDCKDMKTCGEIGEYKKRSANRSKIVKNVYHLSTE